MGGYEIGEDLSFMSHDEDVRKDFMIPECVAYKVGARDFCSQKHQLSNELKPENPLNTKRHAPRISCSPRCPVVLKSPAPSPILN